MRLIIFILLFLTLATASALADGGYVPKIAPGAYAQDITEPTQKAVIAHADGKERMVLQVSFKGKASEFVWLVPTPSVPKVAVHEYASNLFRLLHYATAPRVRYWFNSESCFHGGYAGSSGPKIAEPDVDVLEKKIVGIYDVAVLRARKADDLLKWLRENHYHVTPKIASTLSYYTRKGWIFTAAKIHTSKKADGKAVIKEGKLDALVFDFKTKQPVYPLKISSINPGSTKILLYVVARHRVNSRPLQTVCVLQYHHFFDSVKYSLLYGAEFKKYWDEYESGWHLTKLSATLSPKQMTHDLILKRAKTDQVIPVKFVSPPFLDNLGAIALLVFISPLIPLLNIPACIIFAVIMWRRSKEKGEAIATALMLAAIPFFTIPWCFALLDVAGDKIGFRIPGIATVLLAAYGAFRLLRRRKKKLTSA